MEDILFNPITAKGGARIGWINASWPFATLKVSKDKLDLNVTIVGDYSFTPHQVVDIEPYGIIPILGKGIRIHHNISDYPKKIIFWCFGNPEKIIDRIKGTGFLPIASSASMPIGKGMPVRWEVLAGAIILWNMLFVLDFITSVGSNYKPGWLSFVAVLLVFICTIGTLRSPYFQNIVLKPDRYVNEIKPVLRLFALISGIMSLAFFFINLSSLK